MENKAVLVTGGLGFMASDFIRFVLSKYKNIKVTNLDKITYAANKDALMAVEKDSRYRFVKGDIAEKKAVEPLVEGSDIIVNFAAETHVDNSIKDPKPFIGSNICGVYTLLEACRKYSGKMFFQISTDEVYGSIKQGSFTEESKVDPKNPYSATKASAECLVNSYRNTYGIKTVISRSCNNFGPYQNPEKFIPTIIRNALKNKKIPVYGKGENMREWIFVNDHSRAVDFLIGNGKDGEVYNISAKTEKKNIDVAKTILKLLGKKDGLIDFVKDRPGHDWRYSVDPKKLYGLGWQPSFRFEDGIKTTIEFYQQAFSRFYENT